MKCFRGYVGWMLRQRHQVKCPVTTVSSIMEREGLTHIDLLKIDVERAEVGKQPSLGMQYVVDLEGGGKAMDIIAIRPLPC